MTSKKEIAKVIDHTNLKPTSNEDDIRKLCEEANKYGFASVCVFPSDIETVKKHLNKEIDIATVIGFPHGKDLPQSKAREAEDAILSGATEIDMVINQRNILENDYDKSFEDVKMVSDVCRVNGVLLKVICENCNLPSNDNKKFAYKVSHDAGADFIKTSTGFGSGGATVDDIKLMRQFIDENNSSMGIKASGGIKSYEDALDMLTASGFGIDPTKFRIGASAGVSIVGGIDEK